MRGKLVTCCAILLVGFVVWYGCSNDDPPLVMDPVPTTEGDDGARLYEWAIGPIDGITTVWHAAPEQVVVPVGTTLQLKCSDPGSGLSWINTSAVRKTDGGSIAEIHVDQPGTIEIVVESSVDTNGDKKRPQGQASSTVLHRCVVTGADISVKDIRAGAVVVTATPLELTELSSNEETVQAFFAGGTRFQSVSAVRQISPNHFVTAVGRIVNIAVTATDERFASLIEVRVPGHRPTLGAPASVLLNAPGDNVIEAGPLASPKRATISTYTVKIDSHVSFETIVAESKVAHFTAKTNPPGFEDDITWFSSTKYGVAQPVLGQGATFDVTFHTTWGLDEGQLYQWLGVRADNASFNQDQKLGHLTSFDIYPPGPFGKAAPCCLDWLYLYVHCPAPAACTDQLPANAPNTDGTNIICTAMAYDVTGSASAMATQFVNGLTAAGCPATAAASSQGNGVWTVVFTLPVSCTGEAVCSFAYPTILVNSCWPILTPTNPLTNLCDGGGVNERAPWVKGYQIKQ